MLLVAGSYDVIKYKSILLCRPICTVTPYVMGTIFGVKNFATQDMFESTCHVIVNVTVRCGYLYRSQWQVAEKIHVF